MLRESLIGLVLRICESSRAIAKDASLHMKPVYPVIYGKSLFFNAFGKWLTALPFRAPKSVTVATQGGAPDGRLPWANLGLPRWGVNPKQRHFKTRERGRTLRATGIGNRRDHGVSALADASGYLNSDAISRKWKMHSPLKERTASHDRVRHAA